MRHKLNSFGAFKQRFEFVVDRRYSPAWFFLEGMGYIVGAVDGVIFANKHDGQVVFDALIPAFKYFVLGHCDGRRAFNPAFDFDMAGLGQSAIHGRREGSDVPTAFLSGDIYDAVASGFFGEANGVHGKLLDARAGFRVGGKVGASVYGFTS